MSKLVEGFFEGSLSPRESRRADAAGAAAIESIGSRLLGGEAFRADWKEGLIHMGDQPSAEIFETILALAARQFEQKKARHFGWAFAGLGFDESYDPEEAHYALRLLDGLTYRQLCVLALLTPDRAQQRVGLRSEPHHHDPTLLDPGLVSLLREIAALDRDDLAGHHFAPTMLPRPIAGWAQVTPSVLCWRPEAARYAPLWRLDRIDPADVARVAALLG